MADTATGLAVERDQSISAAARASPLTRGGVVLMTLGAAAWTAVVGGLAVWRHREFLSHRFDLGNMVQAVWSTTQGRPLEFTDGTTGEQLTRLGAHVDPILLLYVPLWMLRPGPETLLVAQAAALAAGVYPVVRLSLKYTGSRLATLLIGAWYLAFPWVIWLALNELNPVTLALPLLLYAIWFLDEHRLGWFALFAALAMLTGELIGLTVAGLGVWYAVGYRRGRAGASIVLAGVAWTAICLVLVVPAFNGGASSRYYDRYESVGGSPLGLLETSLTDPGAVIGQLTTSGDLQYLGWLALPTALLFLGAPLLLVAAVPQLCVNTLSEFGSTVSPVYHYSAPVVAALVAGTVMALGRLTARACVAAAGVALAFAVLLLASVPPIPGTEQYVFGSRESSARAAAMREAIALVPPGVPTMATNRLGAHLSERRVIDLFPQQSRAQWAVVDTRDRSNDKKWIGSLPFAAYVERLDRDPRWRRVFASEGVRVYRRPS